MEYACTKQFHSQFSRDLVEKNIVSAIFMLIGRSYSEYSRRLQFHIDAFSAQSLLPHRTRCECPLNRFHSLTKAWPVSKQSGRWM